MSKKKNKKFNPIFIIFIIIGALCGFFGAGLMNTLEKGGVEPITVILYLMGAYILSSVLVPLIHEAGHLVMGLLTGYDFVSFRIGSLTFIKENGKLVRRKFNIAGTGGQCILSYKNVDEPQNIPYFWYNFGGVFFNLITAVICAPFIFFADNTFITVGAGLFAIMSVVIGIMNFIPTKAMGISNDGYNILIMRKSPADRVAIYKMLMINAMQYKGIKLEDIPEEIMTFSDEEKKCANGFALDIIEANLLINKHDFKAAEEKYRAVSEDENTYELYKKECKCEMMFCMIMNEKASEEIESVYDKELKKYIELTGKTYITRKRLMYAYYLMVAKDKEKASAEYDAARKMENRYPAKGEYLAEMELMEYVWQINGDRFE